MSRAIEPARPLVVEVASAAYRDQFWVKGKSPGREWREQEVSFSGYFGSYGPELFAAAPDLLAASKAVLIAWKKLAEALPQDDRIEAVEFEEFANLRSAVAKALGIHSWEIHKRLFPTLPSDERQSVEEGK